MSDDEILAALEDEFDVAPDDEVVDLTQLSDYELSLEFNKLRDALNELGEMYNPNPSTPESRDLHSRRAAVIVEQRRRAAESGGGSA